MPGRRDPYRRQIRRGRRNWRNRDGNAYPMLILGPDEPLTLLALAAIGRWAFRHRSAFIPFAITAAVFITAAGLHSHHARWWVPVAAITIAVTVLLAFPYALLRRHPAGAAVAGILTRTWEACGIDRAIERGYAGMVVTVTGGWLAAAIATGPTTRPLPQIAVIGCVITGIPWWFHRRRRAKVRVERTIAGWPSAADAIGLPGSRIASVVVDAWGWTARVIIRKGTTTEQAMARIPAIESGLGLRPGSVRVYPDQARADRFTMRVIESNPHAAPVPWPGTATATIATAIEIGVSEDGQPVRVTIVRRNVLIGGTTGAGKSGILNVLLAALAACGDVVLWGVDLKGGMELQPWAGCLARLATTPHQASELFRDAVGWLNHRARDMAAQGKRTWEPARDNPALVIVVDEYAELPEEAHDCADSVARRGRAVAVNIIAATQRPTQAAMGKNTAVRSQMDVRICLRVRERRDADLILGQGSFSAGWHAHTLTQPGAFLISDPEHPAPERNRAYLITDTQIARQAAGHTRTRPALPDRPGIAHNAPESAQTSEQGSPRADGSAGPEMVLWGALRAAGPGGVAVGQLVRATGKGRTWVYERLRDYAEAGRVVQTIRGHWRASGHGDTDVTG